MTSFVHLWILMLLSILITFCCSENTKQWQIQERIIGGFSAIEKQFPFHVSLRNKRNHVHFCGGSIINEQFVITAAHCLFITPPNSFFGLVNITHAIDIGTRIEFSQMILHPEFSARAARNDIALIRTKKLIVFSIFVKPIWLPTKKSIEPGTVAIVSGWGRDKALKATEELSYRKSFRPTTLQYKQTVTISYEECVAGFTPLMEKNFEFWKQSVESLETTLCTGNAIGTGCCIGDSGSALIVNETLIGIVSWSAGCAQGYPDIYTDVSQQLQWINKEIAEYEVNSD